jgi:hypothetical protein
LSTGQSAAHVLLLFEPGETLNILRHINIFDSFTFTLIPSVIDKVVYDEIFKFFFQSPMSTSLITWPLKLIARPQMTVKDVSINQDTFHFPEACLCPLSQRNCSRAYLLAELFHPLKAVPNDDQLADFCSLHLHYSKLACEKIINYTDRQEDNFFGFSETKKSIGIRSRFWLDPHGVFQPRA